MAFLKRILLIAFLVIGGYFAIDIGRYFVYPDIAYLKKNKPDKTAFMKYREEIWAKNGVKKSIKNTWVPLSRISPYVMKAVIIAEDDKFWAHEGFDFEAMQKAMEKDIKKRKFQAGGSTISQQLAKNLYLSPAKDPIRKIKEAIITWRLERQLTKRKIIELYLNVAEWGDGIFGIEAAAKNYYGKHAAELNAHEAAQLASVLPNPRRYKPDGTSRYVENRSEKIYKIMVRRGIVLPEYEEVVDAAKGENGSLDDGKKAEETPKENENLTNTIFKE